MKFVFLFFVCFALTPANYAHAVTPDDVRTEAAAKAMEAARTQALEAQRQAISREAKQPRQGTSAPHQHVWYYSVRSPGQNPAVLQVYQDRGACEANARLMSKQLARLRWGSAACLEQVAQ